MTRRVLVGLGLLAIVWVWARVTTARWREQERHRTENPYP